ncbi:Holliday junction DNA helicase RuvA [marine gamma proteobacterium HTCC2207]|jgi:Holliday junction DNA helicase RuvA|uniref:Holliday junction branch migration complex subunit RuvA n=1 Tax=gamma proteobacterium HTCC2207 TaxID=314287 RepID=Q1YQ61_9GAMM|nr:Holliday junction DNA helicase RuvA [marine gamma proteobacterium HTCC2207] [gamma proteobacterium HTCC2207]MBT5106629.1 Holliday junction branch migration protein RuvA [Porticoccaceae bacterium]MBT6593880.1 Holliday junction branch migration protein RuvA [Porticoccaceae bacterium]MDB4427556.1 Holliday junction branch migration protein RuvA [Porticoccaceae bacterium]MDC0589102.1 Holliday junction branch migration protein RuvA [Porticoccaceae bacterium]
MIGRLQGKVIEKQAPDLLIDVQGVGYEVLVSLNTFFGVPGVGEITTLHTHFVVREDVQQLYGFGTQSERQLFRHLIKVNGVGPKMALAILSGMSANDFAICVHNNDIATLVKLPGVGKKTAERLLIEMRDKIGDMDATAAGSATGAQEAKPDISQEAESALIALGYKPADAAKIISRVATESVNDAGELIRLALKSMGS